MVDQEIFTKEITSKKESEWTIPFDEFEDFDTNIPVDNSDERKAAVILLQEDLVKWCKQIPGCNWSVGYVDDEETQAMVVKWWFNDQDYPVRVSEE